MKRPVEGVTDSPRKRQCRIQNLDDDDLDEDEPTKMARLYRGLMSLSEEAREQVWNWTKKHQITPQLPVYSLPHCLWQHFRPPVFTLQELSLLQQVSKYFHSLVWSTLITRFVFGYSCDDHLLQYYSSGSPSRFLPKILPITTTNIWSVVFENCSSITDSGLLVLGKNLPNLLNLSILKCQHISGSFIVNGNWPNIKELKIEESGISQEKIFCTHQDNYYWPKLKSFSLSDCGSLSFFQECIHSFRNLKNLKISQAKSDSSEASCFERIVEQLTNLKTLKLSSWVDEDHHTRDNNEDHVYSDHIRRLAKLEVFTVPPSIELNHQFFEEIRKLSRLKHLCIYSLELGKKGFIKELNSLTCLKDLKMIEVCRSPAEFGINGWRDYADWDQAILKKIRF